MRNDQSHSGLTVWLSGLSGAGKSSIGNAVAQMLALRGYRVEVLDGDQVRQGISRGLGFSKEDRDENVRRIGLAAAELTRQRVIVIVAAISPYREGRDSVRELIGSFIEVYVNAPLAVCEERDPKGLYRQARRGLLAGLSGVDDPYEAPLCPEVECFTDRERIEESALKVIAAIDRVLLPGK